MSCLVVAIRGLITSYDATGRNTPALYAAKKVPIERL